MKEYDFKQIETTWQKYWKDNQVYKVTEDPAKPKCYVLDMFPYPSGAGLHVGHPLGYIASDIYARYKRLTGHNVLHPMGYDSFGLPAEQYAIQTGQHPAITTQTNINRYREQLDKIGFSYDWSREVRTSDPAYYKWTQWIFIQLFHSFYNCKSNKAEPIKNLVAVFEKEGFHDDINKTFTGNIEHDVKPFSAEAWKAFTEKEQHDILMNFRLAYLAESYVNWCPALGTVLANDEVKDGVSERGGHPVERKLMMQWSLRITVYAERLLNDLEGIDWTESLKEAQRNWIGKSSGSSLKFEIENSKFEIEVFTTRPDTIFGVTFLTLAPEHELVNSITTPDRKKAVDEYVTMAKNRSERERMADVKKITGEFTGTYAIHPFTGKQIPVWIGDYVLAGYGTGAVMAVPAHDSRDHAFAKHFGLDIVQVIETPAGFDIQAESYDAKEGQCINSDFLNGLDVKRSIKRAIEEIEQKQIGKGKTNYRLRDAIFGRQRYWGEPIPVYYKDGIACTLEESELPLLLPEVDKYLPTETGEPPLGRASNWKKDGQYEYELSTMPGWAGSSWYFLRYMDPHNDKELVSKEAVEYWKNVDLYLGGSEHATGHLLYVRFWTKFLFDLGIIPVDEPAKKLINQGMIQGVSSFIKQWVYETNWSDKIDLKPGEEIKVFASNNKNVIQPFLYKGKLYENPRGHARYAPIEYSDANGRMVYDDLLRFSKEAMFKSTYGEIDIENDIIWEIDEKTNERFILLDQQVEKMSKSKYNVVTPDNIVEDYGADTLRLYEMFLGPLEQSKPWNTQGIEGVHRFLKKLWKLFYDLDGNALWKEEAPDKKEWKAVHKLIKKVAEDIENFSFNTSVSSFMICVNELTDLKCNKKAALQDLLLCLSPYAPHITEELWKALGNTGSINIATFPVFNPEYLVEDSFNYPVSINGKHRTNIEMSLTLAQPEVEALVLADENVQKWLEGKTPKKIIFVKGKIVNMVL
ncbi:MAG: class I tRNA ligase family protein [Bacteroidota bacterium]